MMSFDFIRTSWIASRRADGTFQSSRTPLRAFQLVTLLFGLPLSAGASEPEVDSSHIEELTLASPWRLQETGELQLTLGVARESGDEAFGTGVDTEYGITSWLQAGVGFEFQSGAEPEPTAEFEFAIAPIAPIGPWRLAATTKFLAPVGAETEGLENAWEWALLSGLEGGSMELHLEAGFNRFEGETQTRVAAAGVFSRSRFSFLLEGATELESSSPFQIAPGVAWRPIPQWEVSIALPFESEEAMESLGVTLLVTSEHELLP